MVFSLNQIPRVSPNLQIAIISKTSQAYLTSFFNAVEEHEFPPTVPGRTSDLGKDFSPQSLEFYSCIQFEIRKKIGQLILLNCQAASLTLFTTMFAKEQQTSDNLIVKDY